MRPSLSSSSSTNRVATVLLVEDEPVLLKEIVRLVDAHSGLRVHGVATTLDEARAQLFDAYDLLFTDKRLPDGSGIELIRELNSTDHQKKTLMMTVFEDERSVLEALHAGADGYFVKQDPNLIDAMCAVLSDGNPISPSVTRHFLKRLRSTGRRQVALTNREQETLQALAEGLKYHQIADQLAVSRHTVPDYIKSLYRKLGVHDRSSAVYVGIEQGLITVRDAQPSGGQPDC
ncbi:MAG: response regulator transcription factor [Pseudomonadota bacterium]